MSKPQRYNFFGVFLFAPVPIHVVLYGKEIKSRNLSGVQTIK